MRSYSKYIDPYIRKIKNNEVEHCKEQELMLDNIVIPVLERDDVVIQNEKIEKGLSLQKYFSFELVEWEIFLFALIAGVETTEGELVFDDIRIYVGRGSGKNGFISFLCFYFISPYHGIEGYNIDLLANSEQQVMTSFDDVYNVVKKPEPQYEKVIKQHYAATKEIITGKKTNSVLRYNTSSKRGKDSKRTGCVIFDEKHEYLDETNINTLTSGLGKIKHPRKITISTDGHVRGAVFDKEKEQSRDILSKYRKDNRTLVFWCRIEKEEEWNQIDKLVKAIPSLFEDSFKSLKRIIENEIKDMPYKPEYYSEFLTKRCNFPVGNAETEVAKWEDIEAATKQELPDIEGKTCVGAVDYASTTDFVVCGLIFRSKEKICMIQHTFICKKSRSLPGIKAPLEEWEKKGDCEFVDDVEVQPELVVEWFEKKQKECKVNILKIAIDKFRYTILNRAFKAIGFDANERKNIILVSKWDVIDIAPTINSLFVRHRLVIGDVPIMRWYINNTKKVTINGNTTYEKIEENYRKTDGFMMFVAGMTISHILPEDIEINFELKTYEY